MTQTRPAYIPTQAYRALVKALAEPTAGPLLIDAETRVKMALGEIANLWPACLLDDPEVEPGITLGC